MKQDRFWFRGVGVFGVVVEGAAGVVWGGCAEGFFGGLVLNVRDVALGRVPDVLDRVVVGRVRRRMDRCDAFQQLTGPVEAGQGSGVVGSGVVRDDRDLAGLGFSLEQVQREDCLLGEGYAKLFLKNSRVMMAVMVSGKVCRGLR